MSPSILNTFLTGDEVQELAPTPSRVGQVLQYHPDRLPPHLTLNASRKLLYSEDLLSMSYSMSTTLKCTVTLVLSSV